MKKYLLFLMCLGIFYAGKTQFPATARTQRQNMNMGHFYGKVVDNKTNKGIDGATVQLLGNRFDTSTKKQHQVIIATVLARQNGDFSLENLPVFGNFKLRVTSVGYKDFEDTVSFGLKYQRGANNNAANGGNNDENAGQNRMQQMLGMIDKDLGNIKLEQVDATLANVTVTTAVKPFFEMGVDRKVFNVDKNIVSTGQTAVEVMKQIPSLNVDIDGNVTLRNSAPQLFVDGRPTTLTLDEIPADIIDRVELITNPSAKFDASGGNAGILNIVLKKNRKVGYNGGVRAGVDSRGRFNAGGDLNVRQGKVNFFASGNYNQRKSKGTSSLDRHNYATSFYPATDVYQTSNSLNKGSFAFVRAGADYFIDIRNTLTLTGSFVRGNFNNSQPQVTDSMIDKQLASYSNVNSLSSFNFRNYGAQLSFKHNFTENGHDITADINYNSSTNGNNTDLNTYTFLPDNTSKFPPYLRRTIGDGSNQFLTMQSDYENQINDKTKIEAGVRAAIREYRNASDQYLNIDSINKYVLDPSITSKYKFNDQVYAAYFTYSLKLKKWNYQLGLRAESSNYHGTDLLKDTSFKVDYPISLFPSAFVTYRLTDQQDLQINYSRRINRPNFFQLSPIIDISDPQNINIGNPALKPEFTNSFEFSYDNNYKKGANFLATAFFKYSTDLITRYTYRDSINHPDSNIFYNTYVNANNSIIYGLELTNRITLVKIWDLTLNVNFFDSKINQKNIQAGLSNEGFSWFAKMNNNFKLPKGFSIQFSGNYQAKTVLPPNSGGRGFRGGFGGGDIGSAQGYINPRYGFDMAVKKDWTWKGGNSASLTLSMNDIFRTQLYSTYSETNYYYQTLERRRDAQIVRLNFSYRFGKFDATLFKRRNTRADQNNGADMNIMQGNQ